MQTRRVPIKKLSDEQQLLKDGRHILGRAARLATETPKLKVWVPLLCSFVLTGYYLYTLHKKNAGPADFPKPPAGPAAVVVAETATLPQAPEPARREPAQSASPEDCPAIGRASGEAADVEATIQAYEKCLASHPENIDLSNAFANVLQRKGDFNRATSLYHQGLVKDPKNLDAQTGLALIQLKKNHVHEANVAAINILHKAPNNTDALLIEGIVAWRESRVSDAESIFLRGASLDDRREDFHAFLGRIAEVQQRPEEALRQYARALALDPNDSEVAGRRDRLQEVRP